MAHYSNTSKERLATCHPDLQTVFNYVIRFFDNTILYGHRNEKEQFELYKKGRTFINGKWVKIGEVVTYKDGVVNKSKHNFNPSLAVDATPYPIDFKDKLRIIYFAGFVKGVAKMLKEYGAIEHDIIWGGDWNNNTILSDQHFHDLLHYQICEK